MSAAPIINPHVTRLHHLDGMRGLAALLVLLDHIFYIFIPLSNTSTTGKRYALAELFTLPPLHVLINGKFWVAVFFVLSAYVIAMIAARSRDNIAHLFGRRYLRLSIPMVGSTLFAFVLLSLFPSITVQSVSSVPNSALVQFYANAEVMPWYLAIWDGLYNCFRFGASYVNAVLWSMQVELFGSLAVYLLYRIAARKFILYLALLLIPITLYFLSGHAAYLVGFCCGIVFFETTVYFRNLGSIRAALLLAAGLFIGSLPSNLLLAWFGDINNLLPTVNSLAAALMLAGVMSHQLVQKFLCSKTIQWLGRISFCLYLFHWPFLLLAGLTAFEYFQPSGATLIVFCASMMLVALMLAQIFTWILEEPSVKFLSRYKSVPPTKASLLLSSLFFIGFTSFYAQRVGIDALMLVLMLCIASAFYFMVNVLLEMSRKPFSASKGGAIRGDVDK